MKKNFCWIARIMPLDKRTMYCQGLSGRKPIGSVKHRFGIWVVALTAAAKCQHADNTYRYLFNISRLSYILMDHNYISQYSEMDTNTGSEPTPTWRKWDWNWDNTLGQNFILYGILISICKCIFSFYSVLTYTLSALWEMIWESMNWGSLMTK